MDEHRHAKAYREAAEAFNRHGDLRPVVALLSEDSVHHLLSEGREVRGREAAREGFEAMRRERGWDRHEVLSARATDEYLTVHYLNHGTKTGWRQGAALARWEGDYIAEIWSHAGEATPERPTL